MQLTATGDLYPQVRYTWVACLDGVEVPTSNGGLAVEGGDIAVTTVCPYKKLYM